MFDQDHWDTLREKLCDYYLSTFFQQLLCKKLKCLQRIDL